MHETRIVTAHFLLLCRPRSGLTSRSGVSAARSPSDDLASFGHPATCWPHQIVSTAPGARSNFRPFQILGSVTYPEERERSLSISVSAAPLELTSCSGDVVGDSAIDLRRCRIHLRVKVTSSFPPVGFILFRVIAPLFIFRYITGGKFLLRFKLHAVLFRRKSST